MHHIEVSVDYLMVIMTKLGANQGPSMSSTMMNDLRKVVTVHSSNPQSTVIKAS